MSDEDNPERFVTQAQCVKQVNELKGELKTVKVALVGEDMRGGLVKDVQEIKSATSIVKTVFLPVFLSVMSAITVYLILNGV